MSTLDEATPETDALRPTHLEVDLAQLTANFRVIEAQVAPARVMPVLKANAYGHGLLAVAQKLQQVGAPWVAVAYLEEGVRLRQTGLTIPVSARSSRSPNRIARTRRPQSVTGRDTRSNICELGVVSSTAARALR